MCDMNAIEQHVKAVNGAWFGPPPPTDVVLADSNAGGIVGMLNLLADPFARDDYVIFCVALMVLPMITLAAWYRSDLITRDPVNVPDVSNISSIQISGGASYAFNWVLGVWAALVMIAFGVLFAADAINRSVAIAV